METRWTPAAIDELTNLWNAGHSTAGIAATLASHGHGRFTRNAVIGKAHRLMLPGRPSPLKRKLYKPTGQKRTLEQRRFT